MVSDAPSVRELVISALDPGARVTELNRGAAVRAAVAAEPPDLAIIDLQVGKMGGMATCLDLRLEEGGGRLPHVPVLMLLDRRADVFLGRRARAEGWLVKPLDVLRLRRAAAAVLAGGTYEDEAYRPVTVPLPSSAT